MTVASAPAKLNLGLVVGPLRDDGKHEIVTAMALLELADEIEVEAADATSVEGFAADTLVRGALELLASATGRDRGWKARIEKRIPVAAGLGGGSSDAAAALKLANGTLPKPVAPEQLHRIAAELGADVPFFLTPGAKLARGDGTRLEPLSISLDFDVVLLLPHDASKSSTAAVYRDFDERGGERGFEERAAGLEQALRSGDLASLPANDLASSPHAAALERLGAFRADVTGAGPAIYGLFSRGDLAQAAARELAPLGRVWLTKPGWYF